MFPLILTLIFLRIQSNFEEKDPHQKLEDYFASKNKEVLTREEAVNAVLYTMEDLSMNTIESLDSLASPNEMEEEALSFKSYLRGYFESHHIDEVIDRRLLLKIVSENLLLGYLKEQLDFEEEGIYGAKEPGDVEDEHQNLKDTGAEEGDEL